MARLRLELPETLPFSTTIPIRITDLNYGGHVGNDTILSLIHEARVKFLHHNQLSELEFDGVGLIMSDVAIEYKSELYYGDEVIATVGTGEFTRVSFHFYYRFHTLRNGLSKVVAVAKTGMVCYDYANKKVVQVPQSARSRLIS